MLSGLKVDGLVIRDREAINRKPPKDSTDKKGDEAIGGATRF